MFEQTKENILWVFFEDIGKKVTDVGQTAVKKTKDLSEIVKLEAETAKDEKKLSQLYEQIGKKYADLHSENCEKDFAELINDVNETRQNINNLKNRIESIKNAAHANENSAGQLKCRSCGADLPDGVKFCTSCGTPVQPPKTETNSAPAFCP